MKYLAKVIFYFFASLSLLGGCSNRSFDKDELGGQWLISGSGKNRSLSISMDIHNGGEFEISNLPRSVFYSGDLDGVVVKSSSGKWKIGESTNGQQVVDLIFEHADGVEGRLPFSVRLFLTTSHGKPVLIYYHGDPDTDPRLDFEKLGTAK